MEGPTASGRGAWDSAQAGVLVSVLALWPVRTVAHGAPVFNLALAAPVFTFESLFYEERASKTVSNFDTTVNLLQSTDTASLGASVVWAGAAGAGRMAVPHRYGLEACGWRERLALWPFRTVAHVAHVFNLALAAPVFFKFESLFYK